MIRDKEKIQSIMNASDPWKELEKITTFVKECKVSFGTRYHILIEEFRNRRNENHQTSS